MKRNAKAVRYDSDEFLQGGPGAFKFTGDRSGIHFMCPCGCGAMFGATFVGQNPWTWDGNIEAPTVNPSLGCYPAGRKAAEVGPDGVYHWHGFLRAGVFEEC